MCVCVCLYYFFVGFSILRYILGFFFSLMTSPLHFLSSLYLKLLLFDCRLSGLKPKFTLCVLFLYVWEILRASLSHGSSALVMSAIVILISRGFKKMFKTHDFVSQMHFLSKILQGISGLFVFIIMAANSSGGISLSLVPCNTPAMT